MIEVEHISKTYRVSRRNAGLAQAVKALWHRQTETVKALEDVSFTIRDGEMVGYIGPNGAGKSSTIKVLSGVLTPDSGTCIVNGRVPWKERTAHVKNIGVVFGQRSGLWWDVPVIDSFELLKEIYRIPEQVYHDSLDELVTLLHLETIIKTPTRQLSLGQRMRCEIAAALLHRPELLFLDEPTIGLDAVSKLAVRDFIRQLNAEHKTTVILTTHDMQDIEALTHRILLIGRGRILKDCSFEDLKKEAAKSFRGQPGKSTENQAAGQREGAAGISGAGVSGAAASCESGRSMERRCETAKNSGFGEEGCGYGLQGDSSGTGSSGDIFAANVSVDEIVAALYEKYQI